VKTGMRFIAAIRRVRKMTGKVEIIKKVVVELDLSNLDNWIYDISELQGILVEYYNFGEGEDWMEYVPFKVIKVERGEVG
jgi:hypothetical protein